MFLSNITKELEWTVGWSESEETRPERMIPATVPGAVQLDWASAKGWGPYWYSDHYKEYAWMEDCYWTYSSTLTIPTIEGHERLYLVCNGVDYRFIVKLNDVTLYEQEGMFTPFEIDLTDRATDGDELQIVIFPVPKREGASLGREQADQSCKPAVSYGWDWHPRLVPLGIWDDAFLEVRASSHIESFDTFYRLSKDLCSAEIEVIVQLSELPETAGVLLWTLTDQNGMVVASNEITANELRLRVTAELKEPLLWWPNGHGEPILYQSSVEWYEGKRCTDRKQSSIGFRKVQLIMHSGAWEEPSQFPKSRSNLPILLEINGRAIFCKGSNWVNPEVFPGTINEQTYRPLLELAKDAHMNLLRSWGGGIINKEAFFRLCDEMGIMVWQEFPLACNNYVDTEAYLRVLDQESRSIIRKLRSHCSVVMWCGGNELFNGWSGMTDQSLALRLLNKNCYELDPQRPYLMTSPLMGMGHGHYKFQDEQGNEVYQWMVKAANTAYTEFGCPGPSAVDYIRRFIPESEHFPPKRGTAWETHHAFGAWLSDDWLNLDTMEHYFGPSSSLEQLVAQGQWLQAEGYKCIYEESRRQKPKCSMALNWCFNEPWPTAANNSLINWPAEPKPAYKAVKDSCRPILASARISKFMWKQGELFSPEMWILNDSYDTQSGGTVEAVLSFGLEEEEVPLLEWNFSSLELNENICGPIIRYVLPDRTAEFMTLKLRVLGREDWDSSYTLRYIPSLSTMGTKVRTLNI